MGDSTRIQLLWALEESEMCVSDFSSAFKYDKICRVAPIKGFKDCKTCKSSKTGKNVYYSLDDTHIKDILEKHLNMLWSKFTPFKNLCLTWSLL